MRRIAIALAFVGGAAIVARALMPKLHARMMAACKGMFDQMPEDFPPKKMLGGIEEIRANTARGLELLEERAQKWEGQPFGEASSTRAEEVEVVRA